MLLAVVFCALTACSKKSDSSASPTPVPAASSSVEPTATPCVLDGGDEKAKSVDEPDAGYSAVTDVRPNGDGCPRVVFEFDANVPNYAITYADGPFSDCGSGAETDTKAWGADTFMTVKLTPSGGHDQNLGKQTYTGPRDIDVKGDVLKHLQTICDFEADFQWVIGLNGKHPFKVTTFDNPSRLVIDISAS